MNLVLLLGSGYLISGEVGFFEQNCAGLGLYLCMRVAPKEILEHSYTP